MKEAYSYHKPPLSYTYSKTYFQSLCYRQKLKNPCEFIFPWLFSVAFDTIQKALVGVGEYMEATDTSECSKEAVDKKVRDKPWRKL